MLVRVWRSSIGDQPELSKARRAIVWNIAIGRQMFVPIMVAARDSLGALE
jgi:hypothetical protein